MIKDQSRSVCSIITRSSFSNRKNKAKLSQKCPVTFGILPCVYWATGRLNKMTEDSLELPARRRGMQARFPEKGTPATRPPSPEPRQEPASRWLEFWGAGVAAAAEGGRRAAPSPVSLFPEVAEELSPLPACEPPTWPPVGAAPPGFSAAGAVERVSTNGMRAKLRHATPPAVLTRSRRSLPFHHGGGSANAPKPASPAFSSAHLLKQRDENKRMHLNGAAHCCRYPCQT